MQESRSRATQTAMRWPQPDPPERTRPPFDARWHVMFTPQAPDLLTAYWTASRHAYLDLLDDLADLRTRQARGAVDLIGGIGERAALIGDHLGEVARLREVYGVPA